MDNVSSKWNSVFAVINPVAGNCDAAAVEHAIRTAFTDSTLEFHRTERNEDLGQVVSRAVSGGAELILVAGGDGTVCKAAAGVADTNTTLGIISVGTANLLGQALDLPMDAGEAVRLAATSSTIRRLDAMATTDRFCLAHIGIGVSGHGESPGQRRAKRWFGYFAYLVAILRDATAQRRWRFTLEVDGRMYRVRAAMIILSNVRELGAGPVSFDEDVLPDDGVLDLHIFRSRRLLDLMRAAHHAWHGGPETAQTVDRQPVRRRLRITAPVPVSISADGEAFEAKSLSVDVRPAAVSVLVPERQVEAQEGSLHESSG